MKNRIFLAAFGLATLFGLPTHSKGALSFDLSENMPAFFGYSTRQIDSAGIWGATGVSTSLGTFTPTFTKETNGDLTLLLKDFGSGEAFEMFVDLDLTNHTSANPYGIDGINELYFFYNFATSGPGIQNINMQFRYPSSANFLDIQALPENGNQVVSFQGEDLYGGPLIANNDTGTLRFVFNAFGSGPGSDVTLSLFGNSITAVVPEPSSALLLTGLLGLFGGVFRKRRKLAAA